MMFPSSICALIPTYNRAAFLKECIDSILAQSRPLQEIIVVNDGSTDDTASLVASYGSRVALINKGNGGKASALNLGLRQCRSDYVWICDDDDIAAPDGLEHLASALDADPEAGFSYGNFELFRDSAAGRVFSPPTYWAREGEPNIHIQFMEEMFTFQFAMLVRRSLYATIGGFREDLIRGQDHEMAIRLARRAKAIAVPDVIFFQRVHDGQRGHASGKFSIKANENKWLGFGQKFCVSIRQEYALSEFIPTFALKWDAGLAGRAALLQRACICAERALWNEAADDLSQASKMNGAPATPQERKLGEAVVRKIVAWEILGANPPWISRLRALYKTNAYGRSVVFALCRPLVWLSREQFRKGDFRNGVQMLRSMIGILGLRGAARRLMVSTLGKVRIE